MSRFVLALACLALSLSAARAEWQFTRWGMTADEALTASKGQLKRCDPKACDGQKSANTSALLYGTYRSDDLQFTAFASFDNLTGKLHHITLKLNDPQRASELVGAMRSKYGEPASNTRTEIMDLSVWRVPTDQISVLIIGPSSPKLVSLTYQPPISK